MNASKIRNIYENVKYNVRLLPLIGFAAFFQSCMSPALTTLEPTYGANRWYKGHPINESQTDNQKISLIYLGSSADRHQFEVTITNSSDEALDVDYSVFTVKNATDPSSGYELTYFSTADDPEAKIKELKQSIQKENDQKASENFIDTFVSVTRLIGGFAERTPEEEKKRNEEIKKSDEDDYIRDENYRKRIGDKNQSLEFWEKDYLRRTTLLKGESISGIIMLPVVKNSHEFTVKCTIGTSVSEIKYTQKPL